LSSIPFSSLSFFSPPFLFHRSHQRTCAKASVKNTTAGKHGSSAAIIHPLGLLPKVAAQSPIARIPSSSRSAWCSAADSRRSSLTTWASASGLTPLSAAQSTVSKKCTRSNMQSAQRARPLANTHWRAALARSLDRQQLTDEFNEHRETLLVQAGVEQVRDLEQGCQRGPRASEGTPRARREGWWRQCAACCLRRPWLHARQREHERPCRPMDHVHQRTFCRLRRVRLVLVRLPPSRPLCHGTDLLAGKILAGKPRLPDGAVDPVHRRLRGSARGSRQEGGGAPCRGGRRGRVLLSQRRRRRARCQQKPFAPGDRHGRVCRERESEQTGNQRVARAACLESASVRRGSSSHMGAGPRNPGPPYCDVPGCCWLQNGAHCGAQPEPIRGRSDAR